MIECLAIEIICGFAIHCGLLPAAGIIVLIFGVGFKFVFVILYMGSHQTMLRVVFKTFFQRYFATACFTLGDNVSQRIFNRTLPNGILALSDLIANQLPLFIGVVNFLEGILVTDAIAIVIVGIFLKLGGGRFALLEIAGGNQAAQSIIFISDFTPIQMLDGNFSAALVIKILILLDKRSIFFPGIDSNETAGSVIGIFIHNSIGIGNMNRLIIGCVIDFREQQAPFRIFTNL